MIGWKILCNLDIDGKDREVVCEVIGQAVPDDLGFAIPVYYDNHIRVVTYGHNAKIKVIERK